jgi:hypothetical protein
VATIEFDYTFCVVDSQKFSSQSTRSKWFFLELVHQGRLPGERAVRPKGVPAVTEAAQLE